MARRRKLESVSASGVPGASESVFSAPRVTAQFATPEIETAHHAASYYAKDMATWSAYRQSPDGALLSEIDVLSARMDDLARNDGIAAGAERTLVDNVVGPRIMCKPNPDRYALGKDASWVADWSRTVESLWSSFADTDWFDVGLRFNFHAATRLQARMLAGGGEALALPLWTQRTGSKWMTCCQLVDPARLSNPAKLPTDATKLRGGVEMDDYGAAVAYHIRKTHPGDMFSFTQPDALAWERIPAFQEWGRRRVLHLYDPERVGQTRGKSVATPVARLFRMLDKYMTEELRVAVLNSLVFAALETPLGQRDIIEVMGGDDPTVDPIAAYMEALGQWPRINMQGGSFITLPPGTEMKAFMPTRSASALEPFTTSIMRKMGVGMNMGYELISKDFSKTNYSSARAALLEAWRYFASVRQFITDRWCQIWFDLWFEEAVNRGEIPDCTPADYYAQQVAWTRCNFIFAGRGWVDPLKEARAAEFRLKNKITNLAQECGDQGHDWREVIEQDAREQAYQKQQYEDLGLPWPPAGSKPATGAASDGVPQAPQDATQDAIDDGTAEQEAADANAQ